MKFSNICILLIPFLTYTLTAHCQKNKRCWDFWSAAMDSLNSSSPQREPNYTYVIRQLLAYKACAPDEYKLVDNKIIEVNQAILKLRDKAVEQKRLADAATRNALRASAIAQKEGNRAKALFLASESDKIIPIQGLNLLQEAYKLSPDAQARNFIKIQTENIFNKSNAQQFKLRRQYSDFQGRTVDGKYLLKRLGKRKYTLFDVYTDKTRILDFEEEAIHIFGKDLIITPDGNWIQAIDIMSDNVSHLWKLRQNGKYKYLGNFQNAKFSPSGRWLYTQSITGSENATYHCRVFNIQNREEKFVFDFYESEIINISFSPDENWLISRSSKNGFALINSLSSKVPDFPTSIDSLTDVKFSKNGELVFLKYLNARAGIWNLKEQKVVALFDLEYSPNYINFSENGDYFFAQSVSGEVRIFNVRAGIKIDLPIYAHESDTIAVEFSTNGRWVKFRSSNYNLLLWDLLHSQFINLDTTRSNNNLYSQEGYISDIFFSPDGKWIVSGGLELKLWAVNETVTEIVDFFGVADPYMKGAYFSPNSKWLVTKNGEYERDYQIWNLYAKENPIKIGPVEEAAFLSSGRATLMTRNRQGIVNVWELEESEFQKHPLFCTDEVVNSAIISTDGKWIIVKFGSYYRVYDSLKGEVPELLANDFMEWCQFSPDCRWLIAKTKDGIRIWRMDQNMAVDFLKEAKHTIYEARFSQDNLYLITGHPLDGYDIFDLRSELPLLREERLKNLSFSVDCGWLIGTVSNGTSTTKKLWKNRNGVLVEISFQTEKVREIKVSSDGRWIFADFAQDSSIIWAVARGNMYKYIKMRNGANIHFSNNCKWLYDFEYEANYSSEKRKNKVSLYYLRTGNKVRQFDPKPYNSVYCRFSSDDNYLILQSDGLSSLSYDTDLWRLPSNETDSLVRVENVSLHSSIRDAESSLRMLIIHELYGTTVCFRTASNKYQPINSNGLRYAQMSPNKQWIHLFDPQDNLSMILNSDTGEELKYLKGKKYRLATFFNNMKYLVVNIDHKLVVLEFDSGRKIVTVFLNKAVDNISIDQNRYILFTAGGAVNKLDIEKERGVLFSFGDSSPLDYKFDEIEEWKGTFGKDILLKLDDNIRRLYYIK